MEQRIVLSASRTGSQALVAALSEGRTRPVEHIHFIGRRSLDEKVAQFAGQPLPPMLQTAIRLRSAIDEPGADLRVAACIRDPMARQVSHLFKFPEIALAQSGIDVYAEPERAGAWMVESFHRRRPLTWLEEHICEPFGVDPFAVAFDAARGSFRLEREGLRLVVIRLEDPLPLREAGLGWLLGRASVPIPVVDRGEAGAYGEAYRRFRSSFNPPSSLLDAIYGSAMMRHFYSEAERNAMRDRWTGTDAPA